MRFSVLLRKELRECLPWMLLAAVPFLAFGGFFVRIQANGGRIYWHGIRLTPGTVLEPGQLIFHPQLHLTGTWLFISSLGLGLVLGVRHFWIPHFTKTWPFLLHRSIDRNRLLGGKLTAAAIALVISLGLIWIALYWYANQPQISQMPQRFRFFIEGWIFIALGFVAYLGTALSGLSTARWYSTRIFGLAFAGIVIAVTIAQWRLVSAFAMIVIGSLILLSQIVDTFSNREF
ncbi:MAG: hypothetical protein ACYS0H_14865 [Planctomycetota bacterium]